MLNKKVSRRSVLAIAGAAAVSMPFVRPSYAGPTELKALMWEGYVIPEVVQAFEQKHNVKFVTSYFDGNSEAYNKLRVGGAK